MNVGVSGDGEEENLRSQLGESQRDAWKKRGKWSEGAEQAP